MKPEEIVPTVAPGRYSVRRRTTEILQFAEKTWRWSYLKEQFKLGDLEKLYKVYATKINHGYFSLFLILQCCISLSHFLTVLIINMDSETLHIVLPDLILYGIAGVIPIVGIFLSESYVKRHPHVLRKASIFAFVLLYAIDVGLPIYHNVANDERIRPSYTTHLILACHIFFTVQSHLLASAIGIFVTVTHLLILVFFTYKNSTILIQRIVSDVVYYLCINGLGAYFRFINEMMKRRGFLDRQACIQSNLELTYQESQEEQLMLSLIPKSILEKVRKDIEKTFKNHRANVKVSRRRPFENHYITAYQNVTILYADIVNYTEMTRNLSVTKLVETLNDLFGNFDDASEALKVLRIKFLGDCYYCVAGLPPDDIPDHADACVELGLKMIKIIKDVREVRKLDIDMRIGIHTGNIMSGIIGKAKWQFDIWSKDVYIANKIESTGTPGKVHITKQTRDQLKKTYDIQETDKGRTDPFLKEYNIQTYLISPKPEPKSESPPQNLQFDVITESPKPTSLILQPNTLVDMDPRRATCTIQPNHTSYQRRTDVRRISNHSFLNPDRKYSTRPGNSVVGRKAVSITESKKISTNGGIVAGGSVRKTRQSMAEKRRTAFMDNNINKFKDRLDITAVKLQEAIEAMPFAKYDQWLKASDINPFLLIFKDLGKEARYIALPDPLFRYYLVTDILVLIFVLFIQNFTVPQWDWTTLLGICTIVFIVIVLFPLTWTNYIWTNFYQEITTTHSIYDFRSDISGEFEEEEESKPENPVVLFLYNASNKIGTSVTLRTAIYILLCAVFAAFVFTDVVHCNFGDTKSPRTEMRLFNVLYYVKSSTIEEDCIIPWHMTQTCGLAIIMSFLFLKIHVWLKFLFGLTITAFYSYFLWNYMADYYQNSETFNYMMKPSIAHILSIVYLTFTLHLIDRQSDYMNRLDHEWNQQLIKEQDRINFMRTVNHHLLQNILPIHVAKRYLDENRPSEIYCKKYSKVAVMFASIVNYKLEEFDQQYFTNVMNKIIGEFDKLLMRYYKDKIEKIKLANWTYMAACGLSPDSDEEEEDDSKKINDDVVTLLKFAVGMRKILNKINQRDSFQDYKLRIGISHGKVTAGVVGAKKPLYDIWGKPVNMASRMDSTGEPDNIQVTENTSILIEEQGYECQFRGHIFVKNAPSLLPTYFVTLDEKGDLKRRDENDDNSVSSNEKSDDEDDLT